MGKKFWKFVNQTPEAAELWLYGDIAQRSWFDDDVTAKGFADELAALGNVAEIAVRINSGGGDVFAAQAIGNLLERHGAQVTAYIDGLCASAATIVACHCDRVVAAADSTYMIHPVKMGLMGFVGAEELRQYQEALAALRENILAVYFRKTGQRPEDLAAWMDNTSWMTAEQARERGFVDELTDAEREPVENRGGLLFYGGVETGIHIEDAPDFVRNRAERFANTAPAEPEKETTDMDIKTADELRTAYPELVDELEQGAAKAERERILAITDSTPPGIEALAHRAMFEEPMSAADFALSALKEEKQRGAAYLQQAKQDAQNSGVMSVQSAAPEDSRTDGFLDAIRAAGQH